MHDFTCSKRTLAGKLEHARYFLEVLKQHQARLGGESWVRNIAYQEEDIAKLEARIAKRKGKP